MDLSSGRFTPVPGTDWGEDEAYHNLAIFLLSPATYEGDEFILRVQNCLPSDTGTSCVVTLDENAIKTKQFVLSGPSSTKVTRQLAFDPHADDPKKARINNPKSSYDGRWVLLKYGGVVGGSFANPGLLGYLFAVPSDGVNVPLSPYDDSIETTALQIHSDWYRCF